MARPPPIVELRRVRVSPDDPASRTLHFTFPRRGNGRSVVSFVKPEHVPDFEGEKAWFLMEQVRATPWSYWRAVRQVDGLQAPT